MSLFTVWDGVRQPHGENFGEIRIGNMTEPLPHGPLDFDLMRAEREIGERIQREVQPAGLSGCARPAGR